MAYLLFMVSLALLAIVTTLFFTRALWWHRLSDLPIPGRDYLYSRLPSTFSGDIEAGLSSGTFDLHSNIEDGDSRAGLDDASKAEILKIMKKRRMRFDEARRVYTQNRFKANGIGPDGRPLDPKAVTFS